MLEMKLNTTTTVDSVGLDPVNVVSYQKTRQLGDRPLILQQVRVRRSCTGKLHKLTVVAHVDIEAKLIKTHLSADPAGAWLQQAYGFDKFIHRSLRAIDHFPARTPDSLPASP
jgi:hypothetical protein